MSEITKESGGGQLEEVNELESLLIQIQQIINFAETELIQNGVSIEPVTETEMMSLPEAQGGCGKLFFAHIYSTLTQYRDNFGAGEFDECLILDAYIDLLFSVPLLMTPQTQPSTRLMLQRIKLELAKKQRQISLSFASENSLQ